MELLLDIGVESWCSWIACFRESVDTIFGTCQSVGQAADEDRPALARRRKEKHSGPLGLEDASQPMELWKDLMDEVGRLSFRY